MSIVDEPWPSPEQAQAARDVETLQRLFDSLKTSELDQPAGVVLSRAIVEAREKAGPR